MEGPANGPSCSASDPGGIDESATESAPGARSASGLSHPARASTAAKGADASPEVALEEGGGAGRPHEDTARPTERTRSAVRMMPARPRMDLLYNRSV